MSDNTLRCGCPIGTRLDGFYPNYTMGAMFLMCRGCGKQSPLSRNSFIARDWFYKKPKPKRASEKTIDSARVGLVLGGPKAYLKMTANGKSCVMEPSDAAEAMADADDQTEYTVTAVRMTPEQFAALPDFEGY